MDSAPKHTLGALGRILGNVRGVIGDEAARAVFQYAAQVEGRARASDGGPGDLAGVLSTLDEALGQRSKLVESGRNKVRVHVLDSPLLDADEPVLRYVIMGLLAGAVSASRRAEHRAVEVSPPEAGFRGMLVELESAREGGAHA